MQQMWASNVHSKLQTWNNRLFRDLYWFGIKPLISISKHFSFPFYKNEKEIVYNCTTPDPSCKHGILGTTQSSPVSTHSHTAEHLNPYSVVPKSHSCFMLLTCVLGFQIQHHPRVRNKVAHELASHGACMVQGTIYGVDGPRSFHLYDCIRTCSRRFA